MKQRPVLVWALALALIASPGPGETPGGGPQTIKTGAGAGRPDDGGKVKSRVEPAPGGLNETNPPGAYRQLENGIVYDAATRLEWLAGPDQRMDWNQAKAWTEGLSVGGGGWRMPSREELLTLYSQGSGSRNMTPLLQTSGWFVWSGETKDFSTAWSFNFFYNGFELYDRRDDRNGNRAFAVRPGE
ncbi:MAG: DUF1566 domain-containing protein [Thermodesulfobacteriota bacterium]